MASNDFIIKIQSNYNLFTKAEKKVADYVLKNTKKVLFMSISDLAEACKVGDTSVFRFCRTLKLQGYQEFKMQLSLSINDKDDSEMIESRITMEDSLTLLSQKILQNNVNAINETYSLLNIEEFSKAVDYLQQAQYIHFFGVGASMLNAMVGMNKFLRITPKVRCIMDTHMQAMMASMMTERDLAIIISYSGATKDTIHVAKLAKQAGARVICITRFAKSPLTSYSDISILCGSKQGPLEGGSTSSQMSQLYLLDLIYMEYYRREMEVSTDNNQRTANAVIEKLC